MSALLVVEWCLTLEPAMCRVEVQGYESLQLHHLSLMAALLPRFINLADIVISKSDDTFFLFCDLKQ